MSPLVLLEKFRQDFHRQICGEALGFRDGTDIPSNADRDSRQSIALAKAILELLPCESRHAVPTPQRMGKAFEKAVLRFLEASFQELQHLRPGSWVYSVHTKLTDFVQYEHLADLSAALEAHPQLRATLGDYLVKPDLLIARRPVSDEEINADEKLVSDRVAKLTPLRRRNQSQLILHASISCKWTIRSDRSQNARTEGLNLLRNRKGNAPHVAVVTAEPLPARIASIALGTGDLDCVYHFALYELQRAVESVGDGTSNEMLHLLVDGKRLRDISDLPFDLAT